MQKNDKKMSVSDIYVGTKFIGHDSAVFIIDPSQKEIWGMSTERTTRYKHDVLSPEDVFTLYKKHNKERVKKIKTIHIGHSFTTVGLKITKDYYFFHKNFRKHFKVFFKKDVEKKLSEFKKMNIIHKISSLISSINGLALIGLFVTNKIVGQKKITVEKKLTKICKKIFPYAKVKFSTYDHETCHAISSHYTSPFEDEILFSSDGFGDGDFSKVFKANKGKIEKIAESKYVEIELNSGPQKTKLVCSPGKIYSRFTSLLGFEENADEGKVEALAAYGEPIQNLLSDLNNAFSIGKDGALKANQAIIKQICDHENATKIIEKHTKEQISATVQKFLENLTERYLNNLKQTTNINAISLSGGVAANVINNLMIFEKICDKMHVVPAFGDDGSAQGASIMAMIADGFEYNELGWMKNKMPYYGTKYNKNSILNSIRKHSKKINHEDLGDNWPEKAAELIYQGKIGAIFHGRMEWGPRALGNRSIVADPTRPEFRDRINREIKRRPFFQPFCPSILMEERERLFEKSYENKHMTCAFRLKKEYHSKLPSAIHVDGTARAQFVGPKDNINYYRLIKKFKELSGFGVIINTSFNKHGRTIVESPDDAIIDFIDTDMDFLIIEGLLVTRK